VFKIELEFRTVGFKEGEKPAYPEKNLTVGRGWGGAQTLGFKLVPLWWETSAVISALALHPVYIDRQH